jgi:DNA polymerase IV
VGDKVDIELYLRRSADAIGKRLRQKSYVAFGVGVKLKTTDFQMLTRQRRLSEPTDVNGRLYSVGVDLLNEFDHPGPFRLVGMVAYNLVGIEDRVQLDLFRTSARQRRLEVAIDELAERFGTDVVYRANDLTKPPGVRLAPPLDFLDDRTRG